MAATTVTSNPLLKEWVEEEIYDTINYETLFCDFADEMPYKWEGDHIRVVAHVGQNTSFTRISEFGALPAAGQQSYVNLEIFTSESAARLSISTRAMKASAGAPSKGALAQILEREKTGLQKDVKLGIDLDRIFGHRVKGLLNEHTSNAGWANTGAAATIAVPSAGSDIQEYSGDFRPFLGVVAADSTTWVRVRLFRMDTYAEILPSLGGGGTQAGSGIYVSAIDQAALTVTLSVISDVAGSDCATDVTAAGFAIALALHDTVVTLAAGADAGLPFGTVVPFTLEPRGVLSNLCDPSHFGADRTTATGAPGLQSTVLTQATAGAHARAGFSAPRIQAVLDQILNKTGADSDMPDTVVFNPLQRSIFLAALTATTQFKVNDGSGKADIGPKWDNVSMLGYKMKVSHHWPRGAVAFLRKKCWFQPQFAKPGFMEADGAWLARVPGQAGYEGTYQTFDNFCCGEPRSQAVLTGITV
jgi:hypothetical protein